MFGTVHKKKNSKTAKKQLNSTNAKYGIFVSSFIFNAA